MDDCNPIVSVPIPCETSADRVLELNHSVYRSRLPSNIIDGCKKTIDGCKKTIDGNKDVIDGSKNSVDDVFGHVFSSYRAQTRSRYSPSRHDRWK